MIRAGKNYEEGHRYIVALRNLKNADGETLEAPAAFRVFRDNHVSSKDALNARRPHMEALFAKLGKAGIARDPLYLARSEEGRVGKECVGTCRSRWSPYH